MIKKCGFRRKRIKKVKEQRNVPRTLNIRKNQYLEYLLYNLRDYQFIYIDESGFNENLA